MIIGSENSVSICKNKESKLAAMTTPTTTTAAATTSLAHFTQTSNIAGREKRSSHDFWTLNSKASRCSLHLFLSLSSLFCSINFKIGIPCKAKPLWALNRWKWYETGKTKRWKENE